MGLQFVGHLGGQFLVASQLRQGQHFLARLEQLARSQQQVMVEVLEHGVVMVDAVEWVGEVELVGEVEEYFGGGEILVVLLNIDVWGGALPCLLLRLLRLRRGATSDLFCRLALTRMFCSKGVVML